MSIPKHRIPKIKVECIVCSSRNVSTVMSQAHAAGYHRRHICNECDVAFYSLASYSERTYQTQDRPFRDRALTPWEQQQRLEWAAEAQRVTLQVENPYATEFIETINIVFGKEQKGEILSENEQRLIEVINTVEEAFDNGQDQEK